MVVDIRNVNRCVQLLLSLQTLNVDNSPLEWWSRSLTRAFGHIRTHTGLICGCWKRVWTDSLDFITSLNPKRFQRELDLAWMLHSELVLSSWSPLPSTLDQQFNGCLKRLKNSKCREWVFDSDATRSNYSGFNLSQHPQSTFELLTAVFDFLSPQRVHVENRLSSNVKLANFEMA